MNPTSPPAQGQHRNPLSRFLQRTWVPLRARYLDVADLRFIALLLGFGALLVLVAPQGRDVIATISDSWADDSRSNGQWWCFIASIAFLGLQSWLWARFLLQRRHGTGGHLRDDWLLVQLPRLLGAFPFLISAIALWRVPAGHHVDVQGAFVFLLGVIAYIGFWRRYRLVAWLTNWRTARHVFSRPVRWDLSWFELLVLGGSLLLAAGSLAWLAVDPVTIPLAVGSAALAFTGFALVIPGVCVLLALVWRERFPLLSFFVLIALVVSVFNENHRVRLLDAAPVRRPTLEEAYRSWALQFQPTPGPEVTEPMVLVSAAGGASRAALWTTAVLNGLVGDGASKDNDLARHIFAITAVSGGSLGAVEYVASLKAADGTPLRTGLSQGHASTDFLAPAIGGLLYTDFIQRFLPVPLFSDRSWSIERGFETGWDQQCETLKLGQNCAGILNAPFLSLWSGEGAWRPNLLLVGTLQEDGHRIVTSNIDLVDGDRPVLPDTYDFHEVTKREVRASTAIMNSARFSWVSPAGTLKARTRDPSSGHLIDGGYVEASGVETSRDLFEAIDRVSLALCKRHDVCVRPRPIFLTLRNEAIDPHARLTADPCSPPAPPGAINRSMVVAERTQPGPPGRSIASDVLAPISGMLNTQGGRAEIALARLARHDADSASSTCSLPQIGPLPNGSREIRLIPCSSSDGRKFAMSWALSQPARDRMFEQIKQLKNPPDPHRQMSACEKAQRLVWGQLPGLLRPRPPAGP